ncbi:MAG: L,D-transpeptidase family protein, partial [Patescibacteria group bacterium]|nr:L,D-transpeptidase family protein [Patescibacteria group bacterium]
MPNGHQDDDRVVATPQARLRALVQQMHAAGMSGDTIFARLILEGWRHEDILDALPDTPVLEEETPRTEEVQRPRLPEADFYTPDAPRSAIPVVPVIPKRRGALTMALAACAVALSGGIFAYAVYRPPVVYSISMPSQTGAASIPITYGAMPELSDPDFYWRVKQQFTDERASFIEADLSKMQLIVYRDGSPELTVPILAKGRVGSWWETPVGIYKIETRERNHFSSFGNVNMPYSLDFNGNFFIHGWPTDTNGEPVASTYSGGCIRLATEDAASVYDLADVGMPVIVYNTVDTRDSFQYRAKGPSTSAKEYVVADIRNGTVLVHKQADGALPIASITKLITALVVIDNFNLDKSIRVSSEAKVSTTIPRLKAGQSYTVHDLLILMLTESSNEAAEAFAYQYGYSRFVGLMEAKAAAIGMQSTTFEDPSGFSTENLSTPEDLFTLLKYIYENRRFIFDITSDSLEHDAYGE